MLKVSRKLNYGLQLMVALAFNKDNQSIATSKYAEQLQIPLPFLHQIAHALQLNGLIKATPGPKGGLRLGNEGLDTSLFDIIHALEGRFSVPVIEGDVSIVENDIALGVWKEVGSRINAILRDYTLNDLINSNEMTEK